MAQKTATAWVVALFLLFCHAQASSGEVHHYHFGYVPNVDFDVCMNSELLTTVRSSPAGSFFFVSPGGGTFETGLEGQSSCSNGEGSGEENVIRNGDFSQSDCAEWELEQPRGNATISCNGQAHVAVTSSGQYYDVQLKQSVPLINGQWYRLSFTGRSSVRHIIPVGIISPADYDSIGLWADCDLHTDERPVEYLFRSTETIANARFSFYIGEHPASYFFDNVEIVPVVPSADCFREDTSLIVNGAFECDVVCQHAWRFEDHFGPGFAYCADEAYDGVHSAKLQPAQVGEYYQTQLQQLIYVQAGQSYELRFYAKTSLDPQTIVVELVDPQTFINRGLVFGPVISSTWSEVRRSFTANQSGVARLGFNVGNWGPDSPVWIDQVSLRPILGLGNSSHAHSPSKLSTPMNAVVFALPHRAEVEIGVFDIQGRKIKGEQLMLAAGTQTYIWDGLQHNGVRAPSGIYFVQVAGARVHTIKRIVMVR